MPETPTDWWLPLQPDTIDVAPEDLQHFADLLGGDRDHLVLSQADGFDPLVGQFPPFGGAGTGLAEGHHFGQSYKHITFAIYCLLADLQNGLHCLQEAAGRIAQEYGRSDAFTAATVESVRQAFEDVSPEVGR